MSITFSIQGIEEERGYELLCPDCGLSIISASLPENADRRDPDCSCGGYGGPDTLPEPRFSMNLSNTNALELLSHLGLDVDYVGSADPQDILTALAIKEGQDDLLVSPTEQEGNVVRCGRTAEQVASYIERLTRIAAKAAEYGRRVIWG